MFYIISYCVISSLLSYGILFLVYRGKSRKGTYTKKCLLHKAPPVIGVVNFLLGAVFLLLYILKPSAFSNQSTIASPIVFILLTIFYSYFYLVALPLSAGNAGLSILFYKKQEITANRFFFTISTNLIGALLIGILICKVSG